MVGWNLNLLNRFKGLMYPLNLLNRFKFHPPIYKLKLYFSPGKHDTRLTSMEKILSPLDLIIRQWSETEFYVSPWSETEIYVTPGLQS